MSISCSPLIYTIWVLDYTKWIGLTISETKQPTIGNLPSRLTILSPKTRCLSWRPCAKRSRCQSARPTLPSSCAADREGIFLSPFEQGEIGSDLFAAACQMGLEGLVSKRRDRPYQAGRSKHWIKVKNRQHPAMSGVIE